MLVSTVFLVNSSVYAAQEDEQQSLAQERAEELRKRKPEIAERDGIRASLKALRSNGALQRATQQQSNIVSTTRTLQNAGQVSEGSTDNLVSIKHVLTCETEANCQAAVEWGNNNNFRASGVLTSEGHGGEVMYHLFLRQGISPDEDTITRESSRVHEGAKSLAGIRYATWMVDFDPNGADDNGVSQ